MLISLNLAENINELRKSCNENENALHIEKCCKVSWISHIEWRVSLKQLNLSLPSITCWSNELCGI